MGRFHSGECLFHSQLREQVTNTQPYKHTSTQQAQEYKNMLTKRDAENARLREQREQQSAELTERRQKDSVKQASFQEYKALVESNSVSPCNPVFYTLNLPSFRNE